jgi:group II intron reverse transcriptase/maturase
MEWSKGARKLNSKRLRKTEMEDKILKKLEILYEKNSLNTWINKDSELYRFLVNPKMYVLAYENIRGNRGGLTPGTDHQTLDGFSDQIVEKICQEMNDERFKFDRAKRIYIPKAGGKLRPIGIPSVKDKLVQEVIRTVLEGIYDNPKQPTFLEVSHGFRPGRGTHSALQYIDQRFKNMKWLIEGDIKGAYDNINHDILMNLLEKRIKPGKFLRLIRKGLNAGYLEMGIPINNDIGTPQGSVVSPILANIYFHELDVYICDYIQKIQENNAGKTVRKARNPLYEEKRRLLRAEESSHRRRPSKTSSRKVIEAKKQLLRVNVSLDHKLPIRVKYVRYADDWVVGIDGSHETAKRLKEDIQTFLEKNLKLQLNVERTKITHLKSEEAYFLGYLLKVHPGVKITLVKDPKKRRYIRRRTGYILNLKAPIGKLIQKLSQQGFCKPNGFPQSRKAWTILEDHVIVENYNALLIGLTGYYSGAYNQKNLRNIQYILHYSCAMTLGHKHRMGVPKIFKKFGINLKIKVQTTGGKEEQVFLKLRNFRRAKRAWRVKANFTNPFLSKTRKLTRSSLGLPCWICGNTDGIEMHHVKHVRKSKYTYEGFHRVMHLLNRKQIPVCQESHLKIHMGTI